MVVRRYEVVPEGWVECSLSPIFVVPSVERSRTSRIRC